MAGIRRYNMNNRNQNNSKNNWLNTSSQNIDNEPKFYCRVCDRGFFNSTKHEQHLTQHRTCGIDGCTFNAHEKIVEAHINNQHITGLYHRIKNVSTKEEIEKWREERRKNHASVKANLERKQKIEAEQEKRGERIKKNTNRFGKGNSNSPFPQGKGKFNSRKNGFHCNKTKFGQEVSKDSGNSRKPYLKERSKKNFTRRFIANEKIEVEKVDWNGSMFPFKGTQELIIEESHEINNKIDDSEWLDCSNTVSKSINEKPVVSNALASLIGAYKSSDESDVEEPEIATKLVVKSITNEIIDSDDAPLELKIKRRPSTEENKIEEPVTKKRKINNANCKNKKQTVPPYYKRRHITLLEKFLDKDIRHERNVLLQCVRYVVNNNFFEDTPTTCD